MTATYLESKIDGKTYCKTNGHFTKHLRANKLTYLEYYETYITGKKEICPYCVKSKQFYQKTDTYATTCGSPKCVGKQVSATKVSWSEEKRISDSLNKKIAQAKRSEEEKRSICEKIKNTCLEKYGVEYSTQTENTKYKSRSTKLKKYGNEHYSGWEKSAEKNRTKTSTEQDEINNKRRKTNLSKYGVENLFLKPEIIQKAAKSNVLGKEYTLPSGKVIGVRGYEPFALDMLFRMGYKEEQLVIHSKREQYTLPIFDYVNVNQHTSLYYPDIYIPSENKIIEVKSQWWWDGYGKEHYKGRLENNLRKKQAVADKGYAYEVWLFTDKNKYKVIL